MKVYDICTEISHMMVLKKEKFVLSVGSCFSVCVFNFMNIYINLDDKQNVDVLIRSIRIET